MKSNKNTKPNFLCVGAQKAGTTTLHDILKQHPDIYLPDTKEAHFFDMDEHYDRGFSWWLETYFPRYENEKIMGAITPEYLYFEEVPKRIFKDLKDTKIIIVLRNPIDRAFSHYKMSLKRGYETESFEKAIKLEKNRITEDYFQKNHFSYTSRGFYSSQIERYLKYFPAENILFLVFEEDIVKNIDKTINIILSFLEVDKDINLDTKIKSNPATSAKSILLRDFIYKNNPLKRVIGKLFFTNKGKIALMSFLDKINQGKEDPKNLRLSIQKKHELLEEFYKSDIEKLETLISRDLSHWFPEAKI